MMKPRDNRIEGVSEDRGYSWSKEDAFSANEKEHQCDQQAMG